MFTLLAHTPDNSFVGFIVLNTINTTTEKPTVKENYALIMGKKSEYVEVGICKSTVYCIHLVKCLATSCPNARGYRLLSINQSINQSINVTFIDGAVIH